MAFPGQALLQQLAHIVPALVPLPDVSPQEIACCCGIASAPTSHCFAEPFVQAAGFALEQGGQVLVVRQLSDFGKTAGAKAVAPFGPALVQHGLNGAASFMDEAKQVNGSTVVPLAKSLIDGFKKGGRHARFFGIDRLFLHGWLLMARMFRNV
jgi:hypothetical protein